ncbi:MAG: hypothetical protein EBY17_06085 [Acidobacteriia bacterium]|jgi:peptidyl-prolyl cis-trans isomerase C|nr:hypothetical protein [Terriglobia bacterium]
MVAAPGGSVLWKSMPQNVIVNGDVLTDQEIKAGVATFRQELEAREGPLSLEQRMGLRNHVINDLIGRLVVVQEAQRLGLAPAEEQVSELASTLVPRGDGEEGCRAGVDEEVVRKEARDRILAERLIEHWGKGVKPPTKGEIREYYKKNRERFVQREMVHAAHIVKNFDAAKEVTAEARELMADLHERLVAGEDFAHLATEYSDCPEKGGDLGFFPKGTMVDEFDEQVFELPVMTPTPVFETPFGLHIAMVYEKRPAGIASLEEIGPSIEQRLLRTLQDHQVEHQLTELRRKAVVRTENV